MQILQAAPLPCSLWQACVQPCAPHSLCTISVASLRAALCASLALYYLCGKPACEAIMPGFTACLYRSSSTWPSMHRTLVSLTFTWMACPRRSTRWAMWNKQIPTCACIGCSICRIGWHLACCRCFLIGNSFLPRMKMQPSSLASMILCHSLSASEEQCVALVCACRAQACGLSCVAVQQAELCLRQFVNLTLHGTTSR